MASATQLAIAVGLLLAALGAGPVMVDAPLVGSLAWVMPAAADDCATVDSQGNVSVEPGNCIHN